MASRNNPLQPLLDQIPAPFRNRYVIVAVLFAGWMIFFDKHDIITQWRLQNTVEKLEEDRAYYKVKIKEAQQKRLDLEVNKEKFAREEYYMQKNNEDVFIIAEEEENQ
jgi:cell division protein DivIC